MSDELDEVQQKLDDIRAFAGKIERNKAEVDEIMIEFRKKKIEAQNLFQQLKDKIREMGKVADEIVRVERWDLCVAVDDRLLILAAKERHKSHILFSWGYR